jgi:CHASE3 domain sensor protein
VDALSRLIEVLEREKPEINGFLKDLKKLINEKKYLLMEDLEAYRSFLEEVSRKVVRESLNQPRRQS